MTVINILQLGKDFDKKTSENRTAIMGLAMLSVMLFHQYFTSAVPFNAFHNFGNWGVDVFLFLSGMGLVRSLEKNPLPVYYKRRFKRIIPSCFICGSIKYASFLLLGSSVAILKDGLNLGLWSLASLDSWFVHTIIILYALSPLLYHIINKWPLTIFVITSIVMLVNGFTLRPLIGNEWASPSGILSWTIERLPVFVLGMLISTKNSYTNVKIQYSALFLLAAFSIKLLEKSGMAINGSRAYIMFTLCLGMPALIIANIYFLKLLPSTLQRWISFFGKYSLELYLVHGFIFWSLKINFKVVNPYILLSIGLILSCISAYICKKITNRLFP